MSAAETRDAAAEATVDVQVDPAAVKQAHDAVLAQLAADGTLKALRELRDAHFAQSRQKKSKRVSVDAKALGTVLEVVPLLVLAIGTAAGARAAQVAASAILNADGTSRAVPTPSPLDLARHVGAPIIAGG